MAVAERLSEEERAVFDLLTRPGPDLSPKEEEQVKKASRDLLAKLNMTGLVIDWRTKQQSRALVQVTIQRTLRRSLGDFYPADQLSEKYDVVYQHVYESYAGQGKSIYGPETTGPAYR